MKRSTDRYLTTHVGSMIRPPKITEYVEALIAGQTIDQPAFEKELRSVCEKQVAIPLARRESQNSTIYKQMN